MKITLPLSLQEYVQDQIKAGLYKTSSELIAEALRDFRKYEAFAYHNKYIEQSREDFIYGNATLADSSFFEMLREDLERSLNHPKNEK